MSIALWAQIRWVIGSLVIAAAFGLIHRLERQIMAAGTLFPGSRPAAARRLALLLGLLVLGFCTVCWLSGMQLYGIILVGIALLGYGLGCGALLEFLQGAERVVVRAAADQEAWSSPAESRCRVVIRHN